MTTPEYKQLRAFARIDGVWLALLWLASFSFYIMGLSNPQSTLWALLLAVATPFLMGVRLKRFRDKGLDGRISFLRGWGFVSLMALYGALLFAIGQFVYLAYFDHGYVVTAISNLLSTPEAEESIGRMGMGDMVTESLQTLSSMRPIDLVLNMMPTNIMAGVVLGVPVSLLMQRKAGGTMNMNRK